MQVTHTSGSHSRFAAKQGQALDLHPWVHLHPWKKFLDRSPFEQCFVQKWAFFTQVQLVSLQRPEWTHGTNAAPSEECAKGLVEARMFVFLNPPRSVHSPDEISLFLWAFSHLML